MNNVKISHIVHVKKNHTKPKIKTTSDRLNLELVRSQVGSNFNFIASQFEDVEIIIFTEDVEDFKIIQELAKSYNIKKKAFNIPIHGFSEYSKATHYKKAYELLIGGNVDYSMLLDRDYYPEDYLSNIQEDLKKDGIKVLYTLGKEIENLFLYQSLVLNIIPQKHHQSIETQLNEIYKNLYLECQGKLLKLHDDFHPENLDIIRNISK